MQLTEDNAKKMHDLYTQANCMRWFKALRKSINNVLTFVFKCSLHWFRTEHLEKYGQILANKLGLANLITTF